MITSLNAIKVSFCWSLSKTGFQFGSVRIFDPSSPRAAGVSPDETACANENAGPSADAALANKAARSSSRRPISADGDCKLVIEDVAPSKIFIARIIMLIARIAHSLDLTQGNSAVNQEFAGGDVSWQSLQV